jgi:hypothetical protein
MGCITSKATCSLSNITNDKNILSSVIKIAKDEIKNTGVIQLAIHEIEHEMQSKKVIVSDLVEGIILKSDFVHEIEKNINPELVNNLESKLQSELESKLELGLQSGLLRINSFFDDKLNAVADIELEKINDTNVQNNEITTTISNDINVQSEKKLPPSPVNEEDVNEMDTKN